MSRTWDLMNIPIPKADCLPQTISLHLCESVKTIKQNPADKELFCVSPVFNFSRGYSTRKLCFSCQKKQKLDFPFAVAGTFKLGGKKIYLLLEKICS
jgi:hypothetical protein